MSTNTKDRIETSIKKIRAHFLDPNTNSYSLGVGGCFAGYEFPWTPKPELNALRKAIRGAGFKVRTEGYTDQFHGPCKFLIVSQS